MERDVTLTRRDFLKGLLAGSATVAVLFIVFTGVAWGASDPMPPTNLDVDAGSVTLAWVPPSRYTDGSPLTNLASYRVFYGRGAGDMDSIDVVDGDATGHTVRGLAPGVWLFAIKVVDGDGRQSAFSKIVKESAQ